MHNTVRQSIYNEALKRKHSIANVIFEYERGKFKMHEYINTIKENGKYDWDLELSIAFHFYNINITEYTEVRDNDDNIINLNFSKYFNDDNDENKNLMLKTNYNNSHFRIGYYNNTKIDYNFNANNVNVQIDNNINENKNNENKIIVVIKTQIN